MLIRRTYTTQNKVIMTNLQLITPISDCSDDVEEYDTAKDRTFYKGLAQDYLTIKPGMFALFFPQDGHAPGVTPDEIKKLIVKVRVK